MADFTIEVVEKTAPTIKFQGVNAWKDRNGETEDITGWTMQLVVKPDISSPDSEIIFDLAASLVGMDPTVGEYKIVFTLAESCLRPDLYPGELRIWKTGAPPDLPDDARSVDFVVSPAVKIVET